MKILGILAVVLLVTSQARAAEIIVHGPSYHFNTAAGYYNDTYGLGYAFDNKVVVGAYRNSEEDDSVYLAYLYEFNPYIGVLAGLVTGYERADVVPAATLVLTVPVDKHLRFHVSALPIRDGFVNLSVGWKY